MKFDEKSKIDNSIRKHPLSFQSKRHRHYEVLINLGLIRNIFPNMLCDSSKTENYCKSGPVKFDESRKLTILSETIHNPSRVKLTVMMKS